MIQLCYETKKKLKEAIGQELDYIETSIFGEEYKSTGTIVGCNQSRSYFAKVTLENDIIKRLLNGKYNMIASIVEGETLCDFNILMEDENFVRLLKAVINLPIEEATSQLIKKANEIS